MRRLTAALFFCLLPAVIWLSPLIATAQSGSATVVTDADYAFGQALHFHLTVNGDEEIEGLTLFLRAPGLPGTVLAEVPVTPAADVTVSHEVELSQPTLQGLAPFSTITYWWEIAYQDGGRVETEPGSLIYADDQFDWQRAERPGIIVHWAADDPALGQVALDVVEEVLPRLEAIIPVTPQPVRIYLYPTAGDLRAALRLTGRDWVGAHADPSLNVILVTAVNPRTAAADLRQSIPHELTHLLLYQAMGAAHSGVPRWLDEGLASLFEAVPNPNYGVMLQSAIQEGVTIPVTDLCHQFPAEDEALLLAYAQSASLVRFMRAEFGNQALRELIGAYADGASCDSAVRRVLGLSLSQLEQRWLANERPLPLVWQIWRLHGIWLILLLGGFAITGLLLFRPAVR